MRTLVGTHTMPSLKAAQALSNCCWLLREWTSILSPFCTPSCCSACASVSTRSLICFQVAILSPLPCALPSPTIRPGWSGKRRATSDSSRPRFMTFFNIVSLVCFYRNGCCCCYFCGYCGDFQNSMHAFQNAHIVGHGGAAHIEHAGIASIGNLHVASIVAGLHGGHHMHRYAGGADRMPFRFEAAGRIDRQATGLGRDAVENHARALARFSQAHGFVFEQFSNREAVMGFHQRQVEQLQSGLFQRLLPGQRACFEAGWIAPR